MDNIKFLLYLLIMESSNQQIEERGLFSSLFGINNNQSTTNSFNYSTNQKNLSSLITTLLYTRDNILISHWMTNSYSFHKMTHNLYNKLNLLIDRLIESYIGIYGKIDFQKQQITIMNIKENEMKDFLIKFKEYLQNSLSKIINTTKDTDIITIRDEMIELINTSLYLITLK